MRKHSHRASQATVTFTSLLCLTTLVWPTAPFLLHEGGPVAFSRAIQGSYGGRAAAVGKGSRRSEVGGSDASPSCGCFATVSMVTTDVSTLVSVWSPYRNRGTLQYPEKHFETSRGMSRVLPSCDYLFYRDYLFYCGRVLRQGNMCHSGSLTQPVAVSTAAAVRRQYVAPHL